MANCAPTDAGGKDYPTFLASLSMIAMEPGVSGELEGQGSEGVEKTLQRSSVHNIAESPAVDKDHTSQGNVGDGGDGSIGSREKERVAVKGSIHDKEEANKGYITLDKADWLKLIKLAGKNKEKPVTTTSAVHMQTVWTSQTVKKAKPSGWHYEILAECLFNLEYFTLSPLVQSDSE
ncbi:hypothetical protein BDQ12DRAFT_666467 [Crucibulum laeve]|uniref:Uncharacterized protein n=1 Tax=Crucibulum laeve TaxID=68775 RepID=A0A5C3M1S0_9AGAR|nr:hypothetical protein BDQ12DRAFT_666467 [Crucibulum laeve]